LLSLLFFSCEKTPAVKITEIKCQYVINPIGVDTQLPAFSVETESIYLKSLNQLVSKKEAVS
jgi:hypothetical protein